MSNTQQTVTISSLTLTADDLRNIEMVLGGLPYRSVKPVFDLLNTRLLEQGEAKIKEMEGQSQKAPDLKAVSEAETVR